MSSAHAHRLTPPSPPLAAAAVSLSSAALCGEVDHAVADGAQAVVLTETGTVFPAGVDLHG